jgi:hypothetical protein
MMKQFCLTATVGKITAIFDSKNQLPEAEEDVIFNMNLYLKMELLPSNIGHFNSHVSQEQMRVQMDLILERMSLKEVEGNVMLIHMDNHGHQMEGLLRVYFLTAFTSPRVFAFSLNQAACTYILLTIIFLDL